MKFANNWLPWIALRHFLPAAGVRALCEAMAHGMSSGQISLSDLVDERLSGGDAYMETWLIRPKKCFSPLANHLQQYVQRIVWRNDEQLSFVAAGLDHEAAVSPAALQFAFNLGSSDLVNLVKKTPDHDCLQNQLKALYTAIEICGFASDLTNPDVEKLFFDLKDVLAEFDQPLRTAVLKHLGDLFCDRDQWRIAANFYRLAREQASQSSSSELLADFTSAITILIDQSLANAATITEGYSAGNRLLTDLLGETAPTVALANASFDEFSNRIRASEDTFHDDTRSASLDAPLLAASQSLENALIAWRSANFSKAEMWFWSTLRRQAALGLSAASKSTKGQFSCCLIDDLSSSKGNDSEIFKTAVRLLVESEAPTLVKEIKWTEELVDLCVNVEVCQFVIDHAEAHIGVREQRRAVAIAVFIQWAISIPAEQDALASLMLRYLLKIGSTTNSRFIRKGGDFQACFEGILTICERRPEFRSAISEELSEILATRIGSTGYWTGDDIALRLATQFAPDFTDEGLSRVVIAVLAHLKKLDASQWVVVKPSLRLFGQESVARLATRNAQLGREIVQEIMRFGTDEGDVAYAADIIFALNYYPPSLLHDQVIDAQFQAIVGQATQKASALNSSSATSFMMALLVTPKTFGHKVIGDILQTLGRLIDTAVTKRPALSFSSGFTPIRYLVQYRGEISSQAEIEDSDFERYLLELHQKLLTTWQAAIERPSIFAPFAMLRSPPADRAIVHNWAITSLELAESLGRRDEMAKAIVSARRQVQLADGISLAFATRRAGGSSEDDSVQLMRSESRRAFYAGIGRRLATVDDKVDRDFATALLQGVLRHGPREVDAAVLAALPIKNVDFTGLERDFLEYKARIGQRQDLALTLLPLIERWTIDDRVH